MQKTAKNVNNVKTRIFLPYFLPYFSFKGRIFRIFLLFGVTAVVIPVGSFTCLRELACELKSSLPPAREDGRSRAAVRGRD